MTKKNIFPKNIVIKNRKASFSYIFLEKYTAGIILQGTEVKSIRMGKASLQEAYCYIFHNELWIKRMYIAHYTEGTIYNHLETRDRKLLLKKKELKKLIKSKEKGLTIVPIQLFIHDRGFFKIQIALARGKKLFDKRAALKERDLTRAARNIKN